MNHPEMQQELDEDALLDDLVKRIPREELAKRLPPEQYIACLSPEQLADLVAHLPPEYLVAPKNRSS